MRQVVRRFMLFEATAFVVAALIHVGVLARGFEHRKAGIAESVIATVLLTDPVDQARYYPADEEFLLTRPDVVYHCESSELDVAPVSRKAAGGGGWLTTRPISAGLDQIWRCRRGISDRREVT
jgi:hypothetical protein